MDCNMGYGMGSNVERDDGGNERRGKGRSDMGDGRDLGGCMNARIGDAAKTVMWGMTLWARSASWRGARDAISAVAKGTERATAKATALRAGSFVVSETWEDA